MEATQKMSLKLLVDKRNQIVLFAEAGKDFVDFLFHCLALPLGTIASLPPKAGVAGGLRNLHSSIENLSNKYIEHRVKEALLNPKARSSGPDVVRLLLPEVPPLAPIECYTCPRAAGGFVSHSILSSASCDSCVTDSPAVRCPGCNNTMSKKLTWVAGPAGGPASSATVPDGEGGYVTGVVTYMVMDDLVVKPMSTISSLTLLNRFNLHETGDLQERVIDFGLDEVRLAKVATSHKCFDSIWNSMMKLDGNFQLEALELLPCLYEIRRLDPSIHYLFNSSNKRTSILTLMQEETIDPNLITGHKAAECFTALQNCSHRHILQWKTSA